MNLLERKIVKVVWRRLEARMPYLRRYAPLIGVGFIGATAILSYLGLEDAARWVSTIGGLTATPEASPVTGAEFAAAVAAVAGVVSKVIRILKPAPAHE